eukprot:TRINITY_DN33055_c0_g1_i1.p1 TRINITY_DN33055_c0_g1~~TRINITY_DN33055_c0_g1_i1.p1  ORF type:complete len:197 (+),score=52.76 TRINITY_DN33055_c0_g1_i1:80-592(+)
MGRTEADDGTLVLNAAVQGLRQAMDKIEEGTFGRFTAWLADQGCELADAAGGPEQESREVLHAFYRQPDHPWPCAVHRLAVLRELMGLRLERPARLQWKTHHDSDSHSWQDADSMPAANIEAVKVFCLHKGYGGFVVVKGTAYFRDKTQQELQSDVHYVEGLTTYIACRT